MQVYVCYALQFSKGLYTENLEQKKQFIYTAWLSWLYFRFLQPPNIHPSVQTNKGYKKTNRNRNNQTNSNISK